MFHLVAVLSYSRRLTTDIYDHALNPLYRDVLAHYRVIALPCRVGDPDRKGKVEVGVGHAQKAYRQVLARLKEAAGRLDDGQPKSFKLGRS